ncbi:MAG: hypothetical protein K0Q49_2222, partial [Haloplasmataceae bacterium]|nr:hypothetical protein [Haloplasmataceae bacterium]
YASIDKKIKTINITSTNANETKSTTACNLAVMFATKFERVLLIDTDLRRPSLHFFIDHKNNIGLVDCIVDYANNDYKIYTMDMTKYVKIISNPNIVNNFQVMTSGTKIINPAEFLGSSTFKSLINDLKDKYDVIILDSAPSGIIVDGIIVSSICDATLFVIEYNRNTIESTKSVLNQLKNAGSNVIGSLLTKVPTSKREQNQAYYQSY